MFDGVLILAPLCIGATELLQRHGQIGAQAFGLFPLPVVKHGAVGQREPAEKVSGMKGHNTFEHTDTVYTERIDIVFVICVVIFGITIAVQLTYLQSTDPLLRNLAEIAIGMGLLSLLGVGFTSFLAMRGVVPVMVFREKGEPLASDKSFTFFDPKFSRDFSREFPIALFVQIGINVVFGAFLGFQFDSSFTWELSSVLLVISAGVGEELFFTLFLTGVLLSLRQEKCYVAFVCVLNVIIFGIVHMQVYKGNQVALLHVLSLRFLYFWVYYKTRRASIPILLHCFNNFLFVKTVLFPWI